MKDSRLTRPLLSQWTARIRGWYFDKISLSGATLILYSIESVSSVKLSYYTNNKGKGVHDFNPSCSFRSSRAVLLLFLAWRTSRQVFKTLGTELNIQVSGSWEGSIHFSASFDSPCYTVKNRKDRVCLWIFHILLRQFPLFLQPLFLGIPTFGFHSIN